MDSYERTESQKLAEAEKSKRRIQRISQVRQQANTWLSNTRQKYEAEKERSLRELISEVASEVAGDAIRNLKELSENHLAAVGEIGAAHRAAANYPDYQAVKELKAIEDAKKAKARFSEAHKKAKEQEQQQKSEATRLQRIRESVRANEDMKSKNLVERRPFRARNIEPKPETVREKLKRQGYQQSLAKTLRVPGHSDTENHAPKQRKKRKKKSGSKKSRSCHCLDTSKSKHPKNRVAPLEIAANARERDLQESTLDQQSSSFSAGPSRRLFRKSKNTTVPTDDVQFVDANIPLPPQKYKAPPGLAVRVTHDQSAPSAWEQARVHTEELEKEEKNVAARKHVIHKKTKQRGKKALKIARLEQRYKQLANELMTTIEEEEDEGDSSLPSAPPPPRVPAPISPGSNEFVARLNDRYDEIMAAARAQMASLMGNEIELVKMPEWTFPPLQLPKEMGKEIVIPNLPVPQVSPRPPPSFNGLIPGITVSSPAPNIIASIPEQSPSTPGGYKELHRKQEVMKAYMNVKEKLAELENELQRRETENLGARNDLEQAQRTAIDTSQNLDLSTSIRTSPVPASLQMPQTSQQNTPSTTRRAESGAAQSSGARATKVGQGHSNAGAPRVGQGQSATGAVDDSPGQRVDGPPDEGQGQSVIGEPRPPALIPATKSSRIPRIAVKKSRSRIVTQRKRSKISSSVAAVGSKKSKQRQEERGQKGTHVGTGSEYVEIEGQLPEVKGREDGKVKQSKTVEGNAKKTKSRQIEVTKSQSPTKPEAVAKPSKIPVTTEVASKILRHYIEKLLGMDRAEVAQMSTSRDSSISSSSNVQINSSALSSSSSSSKSDGVNVQGQSLSGNVHSHGPGVSGSVQGHGLGVSGNVQGHGHRHDAVDQSQFDNWSRFNQPQDSSTPDPNKTAMINSNFSNQGTTPASFSNAGTTINSTTSTSFPNIELNVIYDTDSTKSTLGSPVPRVTSAAPKVASRQSDLRQLLASICQQQVECLSTTMSEDPDDPNSGRDRNQDLDPDILNRFNILMALGKEEQQGSSGGSTDPSDERRLRGGPMSTSTRSPLSSGRSDRNVDVTGEFQLSNSPLNLWANRHQERIPHMIGQVADSWRLINIERPDW